jgi:hypothetical protein
VREDTVRLWRSDFMREGAEALKATVASGPAPVKSEAALGVATPSLEAPGWPTGATGPLATAAAHAERTPERQGDLRLQLRKQEAEAGDIVLLYGDESSSGMEDKGGTFVTLGHTDDGADGYEPLAHLSVPNAFPARVNHRTEPARPLIQHSSSRRAPWPYVRQNRPQQTSRRGRRTTIPIAAAARGSVQSGFNEVVLRWHTVVAVAQPHRKPPNSNDSHSFRRTVKAALMPRDKRSYPDPRVTRTGDVHG